MTSETKNKIIFSVVSLLVGIALGLFLAKPAKDSTKTEYKYIITEKTDTLKIDKPRLVYKYKVNNETTIKTDSIYRDFKPTDYSYKLDTVNKKFEAHVEGWGGLNKLDIIAKHKDSIVEKTITNTLLVNKSSLYLWAGYSLKPAYQVGIDYTIKNKIIIGAAVEYDKNIEKTIPMLKLGFKIN